MEWTPEVIAIKNEAERICGATFDYVLMNLYRNGADKIGFHRDDEADLPGKNIIASVSFGASRKFIIKHNNDKKKVYEFTLEHGSMIVMGGDTQINWLHCVPEELSVKEPRVNLTFRKS